jgi:tRNA modification GTPase
MKTQILAKHEQVIVALCTGSARAALALLRVCGVGAIALVEKCVRLPGQKILTAQASHTIHFAQIMDQDIVLDQVLLLLTKAPKTFTGQDTVEITCHGNPLLVEQIINLLVAGGARLAQPGEFSLRAVLNGKIDLLQAEAICELVSANTQLALTQSMRKLKSGLSHEIQQLETLIIGLIATLEASFEFLEEEERDVGFDQLITVALQKLLSQAAILETSCNNQSQISQGIKIALLGVPNAGKSTLFNRLVGHDRAIVNAQAGTTRDSIESLVMQQGQLWSLVDTAGIRQTSNAIEQEGVTRAFNEAALADVVLFLFDPSQELQPQLLLLQQLQVNFNEKIIVIATKKDMVIPTKIDFNDAILQLQISAQTGEGIKKLQDLVSQKIQQLFASQASLFALNQRQRLLLQDFFTHLKLLHKKFKQQAASEILVFELREMLQNLANLLGRDLQDEVLSNVFSKFCIGK